MTEKELKEQLLAADVKEEDIKNLNLKKFSDIIEQSKDTDDFCTSMKESFPNFDENKFMKALADYNKESEEEEVLSDEALETVAGGSVSSWVSSHKELVIGLSLIALSVPAGIFMRSYGNSAGKAKAEKVYGEAYGKGSNDAYRKINKESWEKVRKQNLL